MAIIKDICRDISRLIWREIVRGASAIGSIFDRIKECGALVTTDVELLDPANEGRPLLQRTVRSFDGSSQYVITGVVLPPTGSFSCRLTTNTSAAGSLGYFFGAADGVAIFYLTIKDDLVAGVIGDKSFNNALVNPLNTEILIEVIYTSTTLSVSFDGVEVVNEIYTGSIPTLPIYLGTFNDNGSPFGGMHEGELIDFHFDGLVNYDFAENGYTTALDSSGNGNHGTYINAPAVVVDNNVGSDPLNERGMSGVERFSKDSGYADNFDANGYLNMSTGDGEFVVDVIGGPIGSKYMYGLSLTEKPTVYNQGSRINFYNNNNVTSVYQSPIAFVNPTFAFNSYQLVTFKRRADDVIEVWTDGVYGTETATPFAGELWFYCFLRTASEPSPYIRINGEYTYYTEMGAATPTTLYKTYVPATTSNPSIDALGNPTRWANTAYPVEVVKRQSNARSFDGVDQYVDTGVINNGGINSLSCWFKTTDNDGKMMGCQGLSRFYIAVSNSKLAGGVGALNRLTIKGTTSCDDGLWHYGELIVTSTTVSLYLDGNLEYSDAKVGDEVNNEVMFVGAQKYSGAGDGYFNGSIAQATIGSTATYNLAESTGTIAYDASGNGNHGTCINNPLNTLQDVRHSNLEEGFGKAMYFDGASYGDTGVANSSDVGYLEVVVSGLYNTGLVQCVAGCRDSTDNRLYIATNASGNTYVGLGNQGNTSTQTSIGDGEMHTVRVEWNNGSGELFIDGISRITESFTGSVGGSASLALGCFFNLDINSFYDNMTGVIHRANLNGTEFVYDEAYESTGVIPHYVPTADGITDVATGLPLTNPATAGVHNGAETQYDFYNVATDGGSTPAIVGSGTILTDYSFGDDISNPMFKRWNSPISEDRHTLFSSTLEGDCLDSAQEYVNYGIWIDEDEWDDPEIWTD